MVDINLLTRARWSKRYRQVFSGPVGEAVRDDLYKFCHIGTPTTVYDAQGRIDPLQTADNEGKRRVGLRLASFLGMDDAAMMRAALAVQSSDQDEDQ